MGHGTISNVGIRFELSLLASGNVIEHVGGMAARSRRGEAEDEEMGWVLVRNQLQVCSESILIGSGETSNDRTSFVIDRNETKGEGAIGRKSGCGDIEDPRDNIKDVVVEDTGEMTSTVQETIENASGTMATTNRRTLTSRSVPDSRTVAGD